jgi:hypothetical protein
MAFEAQRRRSISHGGYRIYLDEAGAFLRMIAGVIRGLGEKMQNGSGTSCASDSLRKKLDKHFVACAAAAAAVGVFSNNEAQAVVQYSGLLDIPINPAVPAGLYIDVNGLTTGVTGAGVPGFDLNIFNLNFTDPTAQGKAVLLYTPAARPARPIGTNSGTGAYGYVSKLGAGVSVGAAGPFLNPPTGFPYPFLLYSQAPNPQYPITAPWAGGVVDGFMGFRFTSSDSLIHFGWARLNVANRAGNHAVTLRDFGWETDAGVPILTGAGIPEPATAATLGLLALGAVGIRPMRSLRKN